MKKPNIKGHKHPFPTPYAPPVREEEEKLISSNKKENVVKLYVSYVTTKSYTTTSWGSAVVMARRMPRDHGDVDELKSNIINRPNRDDVDWLMVMSWARFETEE